LVAIIESFAAAKLKDSATVVSVLGCSA